MGRKELCDRNQTRLGERRAEATKCEKIRLETNDVASQLAEREAEAELII